MGLLNVSMPNLPGLPAGHPLETLEVRAKTDGDAGYRVVGYLDGIGAGARWILHGVEYQLQVTRDAIEVRVVSGLVYRLSNDGDRVDYTHLSVSLFPRHAVATPKTTCECGAAKCGVGRGMAGHSDWCPESTRGVALREIAGGVHREDLVDLKVLSVYTKNIFAQSSAWSASWDRSLDTLRTI